MNCQKCNSPMAPDDMFCPMCGTPAVSQRVSDRTTPMQSVSPQSAPIHTEYDPRYVQRPKNNGGLIAAVIIISALIVCMLIFMFTFFVLNKDDANNVSTSDAVYTAPVFNLVTASSTRSYDVDTSNNQVVYYFDEYVMDGDLSTAWTPDRSIDPTPYITIYADKNQTVHGIRMTNGYCKSEKTYTKNRRISKVRITYNGGEVIKSFGANHYREMIDIPFNEVAYTNYVTVQVLDAYYGEWNDIAISEIEIY